MFLAKKTVNEILKGEFYIMNGLGLVVSGLALSSAVDFRGVEKPSGMRIETIEKLCNEMKTLKDLATQSLELGSGADQDVLFVDGNKVFRVDCDKHYHALDNEIPESLEQVLEVSGPDFDNLTEKDICELLKSHGVQSDNIFNEEGHICDKKGVRDTEPEQTAKLSNPCKLLDMAGHKTEELYDRNGDPLCDNDADNKKSSSFPAWSLAVASICGAAVSLSGYLAIKGVHNRMKAPSQATSLRRELPVQPIGVQLETPSTFVPADAV